jgi:hypothetical protein
MMIQYTLYRLKPGKNNLLTKVINNTKKDFTVLIDLFNGNIKRNCQAEIARLSRQISIIENNLHSPLSFTPQTIDIIR